MRKFLLTTAVILPLSMGTAFAQEDPSAPAADDPAATEPMGTDPAAADAADPAAEEAAAEAAAAELAASGKVVDQQAPNELRLEWITDATVTAPDGTSIGEINDLIVDGENGQMIAAIIGVGGFLGIGQKQIAVPWEQLTVNYDAQEVTSDLTKEEADAAPEYVFRDRDPGPDAAASADGGTAPADPAAAPADPAAAPAPADPAMDAAPADAAPADPAMEPADPAADPMAEPATDPAADPMAEPAPEGEAPAAN
ncbi:PRC-barrel domain-containing protein [Paracoccus caeni]|uniref:PRC-barrel domain-containing protein n=1 Tax=Paracoccus caeni TaxID=657651 RepID=A0A934SBN7_9RHOB|nr:PRC-barrel domain-containing protein [Paracoccus caeni]MBK4215930.1 PRC-barrel domain-containing protein [Paracoccus caeni]